MLNFPSGHLIFKHVLMFFNVNDENIGCDNDSPVNQNFRELGVITRFNQAIVPHVDLGLVAAIRRHPFNHYEIGIGRLNQGGMRLC
ncbi:hypothetical protein AQUSIP_22770 [Aquicella siphonis]|uniref:Uncharacterized protein n=1 Tax=Aquicella siphonis TaxID=254247 RepID=A0A5E4PIQ5_9COXI|nr:hypothetical protein AQUSIP_22770 [Aquicella siphonis]